MRRTPRFLDTLRLEASALENHVVDEFLAGRLDRRALLREGSRLGLALPLLGGLLGLPGSAARAQTGKPGATIRIASPTPAGAIDPVSTAGTGGLMMLGQTGEYLVLDQPDLVLRPMLALSWKPNDDATIWNFSLRPNVKFHNGHVLNADDVVATMNRLCDPKIGSSALSAFRGVLAPGGARKVDDLTVAFHLEAANGNFPYLVSSDNYNAIILPADYGGDFEKNFNGTGPFKLDKYTAKLGASFVRNTDYWGPKALPARTEFTFFADQQPQLLALQGDQVDVIAQLAVQGAQGLLSDPDVRIIKTRSALHRQVHMRTDVPKFADKRVRQAIAMTLDRPAIITGLFRGLAEPGNDSPFAPVYPSTDHGVPQRKKDIPAARALMAAAGVPNGFQATLTTERMQEIPDYAVLIQNACAEIGVKLTLKVEDVGSYYGNAKPGESDWLDSEMGITDYGHRGIPNVLLGAPLLGNGAWNAAHFKNPAYDALVAQYGAATDLGVQRGLAGKIQTLLLDETPVIFGYFYNGLAATSAAVSGVKMTGIPQIFLSEATIT
ncbi:ABC transporter substrate-binding protein [Acidisphaera sp. L21]|uniref:ABC transporter substrate-binding protein n=1 Tax=Acidisphaera sp. L21 TaxID=1641851 RepID=UPI00131CA12B|nr:ABC transporter substrate-binding protein [Acidisphaera sp. L21]